MRGATRTGTSLLISRDHGKAAAEQAVAILGSVRGLAAKVGQMARYVDGFVPDDHREAYEAALSTLRAAAPRSSASAIRELVERELGLPIEELFAEWDEEPFASASIGQVHRARLADGREVAVKAQHPGVDRAVESDLENGRLVQGVISALGPRALSAGALYDEIAARFREELDYELEARRQLAFAQLHAGDRYVPPSSVEPSSWGSGIVHEPFPLAPAPSRKLHMRCAPGRQLVSGSLHTVARSVRIEPR